MANLPDRIPPADPAELGNWVRERLRRAVPDALNSIVELSLGADSEMCRLQASKDVLGLLGVNQKQSVEVDVNAKRGAEEVDHELQKTLERLNAGRMAALPAASAEVVVLKTEETTVVLRQEENENGERS